MAVNEIPQLLCRRLEEKGFHGRVLPAEHVAELRDEIERRHRDGEMDGKLYSDYMAGFEYDVATRLPGARSIMITAAPQPQRKVTFHLEGQTHSFIIPPTYYADTDHEILDMLQRDLAPDGYRLHRAVLPLKLLAARCGMAEYGRNNVAYMEGMGSFARLRAFLWDMPAGECDWHEPRMMKECHECRACLNECPAQAIVPDRFIVRAERCITFFNEDKQEFRQWIDPSWHNSLIGCMKCQLVCPANRQVAGWVEGGEDFDEAETAAILDGVPVDRLPPETADKLKRGYMLGYLQVLPRNLRALLR